jgi:hypothetical protein
MISSNTAIKPAALLQQALPADWTPEEQLFFRNWLQQVVALQDTLTSIGKDQPRLLWRACKTYLKLRGALVRAAEAAEQHNAQNQRQTTKGQPSE